MVVSTKAIVISKIKYNDSDLIVKCYTASSGVKSYMTVSYTHPSPRD